MLLIEALGGLPKDIEGDFWITSQSMEAGKGDFTVSLMAGNLQCTQADPRGVMMFRQGGMDSDGGFDFVVSQ